MASLSVRTRFEVFKRDDFTCRYCGKKSPEVVLEVDHINPKSAGGSDDPINLATSCWDCNRGKGPVTLDRVMTGEDPHDRAIEELERLRQIQEMEEVQRLAAKWRQNHFREILSDYEGLVQGRMDDWRIAWLGALKRHTPTEVREATEIAVSRCKVSGPRYMNGILKNWREDGRG